MRQMLHHPVKVVAERGVRNMPGRVSDSKESISVVACINAAGQEVPPLCIVRGKTERVLRAYKHIRGRIWSQVYLSRESLDGGCT